MLFDRPSDEPLVSIIMPGYNSSSFIEDSIRSVLNQSYLNWELLFVDDGSTDGTLEFVKSFNDKRIKVFSLGYNSGSPTEPRNFAIAEAKGKYIAFLDADDTWEPNKLDLQLHAMTTSNVLASHGYYYRVRNSTIIGVVESPSLVTYNMMLKSNRIGNLTGIYNCHVLGKFYQKNIGHEDFAMWLSILSKTNSIGVMTPIAKYQVSESSISSNKFKASMWHYEILRNEAGLSFFKASFFYVFYLFYAVAKRF
ncbi:glycosyltransferase [Shewanella sp. NKUCC05_KAH]|uniref:Glycosyltransferase n=1 Tax=Shewanella oncorhynchi TaxID=2726434 RepID=A0ABX1KM87_9GAMM|nr:MULTISPECIES: glycosyltransferase [Shewanella]MBW3526222.1 glycosyltransferase [Shewanella sp. NKUCC05_KAH]NLQ22799.1 glycosyltransferase [Shewanella oncorhynchi]